MENLKVRFNLSSDIIIDRFSTFDSIVMAKLFSLAERPDVDEPVVNELRSLKKERKDFIQTEDVVPLIQNIIEVKNNVISGSVWFIEKDADIIINNQRQIKKQEGETMQKISDDINGKHKLIEKYFDGGGGTYKAYMLKFESMSIESLYFYVRADKKFIDLICRNITFIGKKAGVGSGWVSGYEITEIETDKSFMLDGTTPARPLPCEYFNLDSHKKAFWRINPPYYLKAGKVACYMPNSPLYETEYIKPEGYDSITTGYISPSQFVLNKGNIKGKYHCDFCGGETDNKDNFKKNIKSSFNDVPSIDKGNNICNECLSTISESGIRTYANIFKSGEKTDYFQGKNAAGGDKNEAKKNRNKMLMELSDKLPFMFAVKSIKNNQHVVFKSTVSISNELLPFQYAGRTLWIDRPLLIEAKKDFEVLLENGIDKYFINAVNFDSGDSMSYERRIDNKKYELLNAFLKKYSFSVRMALFWIDFSDAAGVKQANAYN